jgi:hypothetical protein
MASKKKPSNKPNKKKASRAARSKPGTGSKPVSQTEAELIPPALVSQPRRLRPEVLVLVIIAVLAVVVVGVLGSLKKSPVAPAPTSGVSDDTPSTLQVVGGNGTGSTGSADALQPQPGGLQQAPTTQAANGTALQAPNTPGINPLTLPD